MSTNDLSGEDHRAVCETVYRYASAIDTRDWELYRSIFTDEVGIDFSSYNGRPASTMPADAWVANVRTLMTGLVATQHSMTNPTVTITGDEATCVMYMQAVHVLGDAPAGADWFDIGGFYTDRLVRTPEGWRIRAVTLTLFWRRGDEAIMTVARQRGAERLRE